jgi:hypothetical protein
MQSIMRNYKSILDALENNEVPDPDYCLEYTEEMIDELYQKDLLNKTDKAQYEKRKQQIEEGKKRVVKPVEKGDWQCKFCDYQNTCNEK